MFRPLTANYPVHSYKKLDAPPLVFFQAAIDHVIRAARVFRQQGGSHLLLVGIDGTGKATSCKLAAHLANCVVSRWVQSLFAFLILYFDWLQIKCGSWL